MDRFSQQLAASLISDRHRDAGADRRISAGRDVAPGGRIPRRRAGRLWTRLAALAAALAMTAVLATSVSAAPVERTRSTIECDGIDVTLVMHPGWAAPVQWDISTEDVPNAPSYIAQYIEGDVYLNGQYSHSFTSSIGAMVGLGDPIACEFEVHKPGFDVYGYTELVVVPAP